MAEEVGAGLGAGEILLEEVCERGRGKCRSAGVQWSEAGKLTDFICAKKMT